jgi:hypothetical protein
LWFEEMRIIDDERKLNLFEKYEDNFKIIK